MQTVVTTHVGGFQGLREYMEDTHLIKQLGSKKNIYINCVFDGHGGKAVAELCKNSFEPVFEQCLIIKNHNVADALKTTYAKLDELAELMSATVGSTAVTVVIDTIKKTIWFANAGDSLSMVVYDNENSEMMSQEHKASSEVQRIEASKHFLTYYDGMARVDGTLNLSRSIGDHYLKSAVISDPFITSVKFEGIKCIVTASDGIWDVYSKESLSRDILRRMKQKKNTDTIVKEIIETAYKMGSTDNITLIITTLHFQ